MRWLQKVPNLGDEVVFVVWDMQNQPDRQRYQPLIAAFSSINAEHVRQGGVLKLVHTRARNTSPGEYRDLNNRIDVDFSKLGSISCSYFTNIARHNHSTAQFTYSKGDIDYMMEGVFAIQDEALRNFALQHMYPVVVVDKAYTDMLNDIGAAVNNNALLEARFGGAVTLETVVAEAQALGIEVLKNEREFLRMTEHGAFQFEDTQELMAQTHAKFVALVNRREQEQEVQVEIAPPVPQLRLMMPDARPADGGRIGFDIEAMPQEVVLRPIERQNIDRLNEQLRAEANNNPINNDW